MLATFQFGAAVAGPRRGRSLVPRIVSGGSKEKKDPSSDPEYRRGSANTYWRKRTPDRKSAKGKSLSNDNDKRRRGRPAHMRSPDDTPLRDGNRDRLMGLLTDRAARTLMHDATAANPALHDWLVLYLRENEIPENGNWSDVSGENFLRKLLTSPIEQISCELDPAYANASPIGGDPRLIAQRIMDARHEIAKEWIEELQTVPELNAELMQETLMSSFTKAIADGGSAQHPELQGYDKYGPDNSAIGDDD